MAAVTICLDFKAQRKKSVNRFHLVPFYYHEVMGLDATMSVFFLILSVSCLFHSPLSPSSRGSLVPLNFLPLEWYHLSEAIDTIPHYLDSSL